MILNEFFNLYQTESTQAGGQEQLQAELDQLQRQFDPHYQYSDDYTFWSKQNRIAQRMSVLKKLLAKGQQDVTEGMDDDDEPPYHARILDRNTKKVIADDGPYEWEDGAVDRAEAYLAWAKTKGMDIVAQVYQPAHGKNYVTWQVPDGNYDIKEQGVAEGKEDKIAQLKKDYATAVHWSKNDTNLHKREAARQKAEKIKGHLEKQYKQGVAEAKPEDSKIGGRYTPNEFDSKLARIKAKHQANPANTADLAARLQAAYKKQTPVKEANKETQGIKTIPLDPELRAKAAYAQGHYPEYRNNPEGALLKLMQRASDHGEATDHDQNQLIKKLTRDIGDVKQQINMLSVKESRDNKKTLLKQILKG